MNDDTGSLTDGRNSNTRTDPYRALLLALVDADPDFVTGVARSLAGTLDDDGRDGVRGHVCGPVCGRPFGPDATAPLDILWPRPAAPGGDARLATAPPLTAAEKCNIWCAPARERGLDAFCDYCQPPLDFGGAM